MERRHSDIAISNGELGMVRRSPAPHHTRDSDGNWCQSYTGQGSALVIGGERAGIRWMVSSCTGTKGCPLEQRSRGPRTVASIPLPRIRDRRRAERVRSDALGSDTSSIGMS